MVSVSKASRVSDQIFLCDILESNRAEVERFRAGDDGAHSFARYFDFIAALEGTKVDLELRTRNAIKVAQHLILALTKPFSTLTNQNTINAISSNILNCAVKPRRPIEDKPPLNTCTMGSEV